MNNRMIVAIALISTLFMVNAIPAFAQTMPVERKEDVPSIDNRIVSERIISPIGEKVYDTEDGMFTIHYDSNNVNEDYAKFVAHAFSKAREFQTSLGFNNITLPLNIDGSESKVAIYVKDLVYEDRTSDAVIGNERLQYFLVSDNLDKKQVYLAAANEYFNALQTSYNTLGYEASVDKAWINDGIAKFITLYTAMNDPEYKQYDEEYAQYGYLNNVMVEGKKTYGYAAYQVPTVTSDSPLNNGVSKLGALSVSYWYYLHSIYGMQVIEDVISKSGSFNDDSVRTVSSVLTTYNTTFADTVTGWYKSLGFWNKEKIGDFSVYEGLMLVNDEMFEEHKTNELPLKIENSISRYGASFVNLKFNSNIPMAKIRFLNSGDALQVHAYIYNAMIDKYYQESFTVERGHHEFTIWGANAEINFIVIGSEGTVNGGFTISGGL